MICRATSNAAVLSVASVLALVQPTFAAPIAVIEATGSAEGDQAEATPPIASFGGVSLGGVATRRIRITNSGDQDLVIGSIAAGSGFALLSSSPSDEIEPGESTIVRVAFEPVVAGPVIGAFFVAHNGGPGSDTSVVLSGVGVDADGVGIGVSTSDSDVFHANTVSLGSTDVGDPEDYSVRIHNSGTQTLEIGEVISSDPALSVDEQPAATIPPGESTEFHLISTALASVNGTSTISFTTNVPEVPTFSFTASFVVEPEVPVLEVTTDAGVMASGDTFVGETTNEDEDGEIEVELENIGSATLTIESVTLSSGFATDFATTLLAADESDTINIDVDSTTPGLKTGTLVITTDSVVDPVFTLNLETTVIPENTAFLLVTSDGEDYEEGDDIEFPQSPVGVDSTVTLTLQNLGSIPLEFTSISTTQGFTPSLTSLSLDPAGTADLTITAAPTRPGKLRGQLVLFGPTTRSTFRLEARALPAGAVLQVVQDGKSLNLHEEGEFRPVYQGSSVDAVLQLKNLGTSALQLAGVSSATPGISGSGFDALLAPGGTASATLTYTPADDRRPRSLVVDITSDSVLQPTTSFKMEVDVRSATPEFLVLDDDSSDVPDDSDFDFGSTTVGNPVVSTFTVFNAGIGDLTIRKLKAPKGFRVVTPPDDSLEPSESTTFTIELTAARAGLARGKVSVSTNDPDEKKFAFDVQGTVTLPANAPAPAPGEPIDAATVARVLARYGSVGEELDEDINDDGVVDIADLLETLAAD